MPGAPRRPEPRERGRRLVEGLFLPIVLAVMAGAAWYAGRPQDPEPTMPLPDFSLPGLEIEAAFELPYVFTPLQPRPTPRLRLVQDTERVIVEVREALLESSTRDRGDVGTMPIETGPAPVELRSDRLAAR